MSESEPIALDERRHPGREESWGFGFATADGALAGLVEIGFRTVGPAWYVAVLVGDGRRELLVRDAAVPPPRAPRSLEIRAEGLWATHQCETPLEHWSVGLEAFAVALDDPADALRDERGDRVGLGFDLEWERAGPISTGSDGYALACVVHGEVLVGSSGNLESVNLSAGGHRHHRWGPDTGNWPRPAPPGPARQRALLADPLDPLAALEWSLHPADGADGPWAWHRTHRR